MSKQKDMNIENARRIEQARECEPSEDPLSRFKRALKGELTDRIPMPGNDPVPVKSPKERLLFAIERAKNKYIRDSQPPPDLLSPDQRQELANDYRQYAAELERG